MYSNTLTWENLPPISDQRLFEARAQLHQAAQLLAAAGISYLAARPDDSHTAMFWSPENHQFLSQPLGNQSALQVSLTPADLSVSIYQDATVIHTFQLSGMTLQAAAAELQHTLEARGLPQDQFTLQKHYELPDYPQRLETAFDATDTATFQLISASFNNAYLVLDAIRQTDSRSSELLVWPHHFDLGMLITVATDPVGNLTRSLGLGLSPGDGNYTAPYYYVTNWPAPQVDQIPGELGSQGHWHTTGWTGMVLPLAPITAVTESAQQQQVVAAFLSEALDVANTFSEQN